MPKKKTTKAATKKAEKAEQKPESKSAKQSKGLAVAGLIINILILPGVGTIIGGNARTGLKQLFSVLILFIIMAISRWLLLAPLFIIVWILYLGVWIWGIVSSVKQLSR